MDDQQFLIAADQCLSRVAKRLEALDPDEADYSTAEGAVTIEFPDGARFILSRQPATKQLWLAAGVHGFHYNWDAARGGWIDDKDGHDLYLRLAEAVAEKLGHPVKF